MYNLFPQTFSVFSPFSSTAQPKVESLMTSVGNGSGPHSVLLNAPLEMECEFSGIPTPVHTWYQNGSVVQSKVLDHEVETGSGMSNNTNMVIQESFAPKPGVYQCHVSNQHGVDISSTVVCAHSEYTLYVYLCE